MPLALPIDPSVYDLRLGLPLVAAEHQLPTPKTHLLSVRRLKTQTDFFGWKLAKLFEQAATVVIEAKYTGRFPFAMKAGVPSSTASSV